MILDRLLRRRQALPTRLACYGKLPLHREFLRFHLDSEAGRWLVPMVDGAHQVLAANRTDDGAQANIELRVVVTRDGGRSAVAALIRPSADGGTRAYPICVFAAYDASDLRTRWHLTSLWLAPVWDAIHQRVLDAALSDRTALAAALDATVCTPDTVEICGQRFQEATDAAVASPWAALTGADAERARQLALTFAQLGQAQRTARGANDGVALRIPLAAADTLAFRSNAAMQTATWVRLFAAVSGVTSPWQAIIEVWPRNGALPDSVCIFGREPTPLDLAHLMAGVGDAAIDRIDEPWTTSPASERVGSLAAKLVDEQAHCMADLWRAAG